VKPLYLEAVGLAAPGLPDWRTALDVLAGRQAWAATAEPVYQPQSLPPNERRRATPSVRLAFRVAEDARAHSTFDFATLPSVFASSDAEMSIIHRISSALAEPEQFVSPTDFHNSVHNAACGYWSIGVGSRKPATTIAGYDGSFAVGLLEAATWTATEEPAVLLVAYDLPAPEPLLAKRPVRTSGGCALVVTAEPTSSTVARLAIALSTEPGTTMADEVLEGLRVGNPALRSLPLLSALARREASVVYLPYDGTMRLRVAVQPT
jgi:hypothetical protein